MDLLTLALQNRIENKNGVWVDNAYKLNTNWSFNNEWKDFTEEGQIKTWGTTAQQRLHQFYIDTNTTQEYTINKIILDAGCGNGILTKAIAKNAKAIVGIDVHHYLPKSIDNTFFVQADFCNPPFTQNSFDIIIANGSIHHTANTKKAFDTLANLTKKDGRLFVWVYKRPEKNKDKILLKLLDGSRFIISRMPAFLQKISVIFITAFFYLLSRVRKGENTKKTFKEIKTDIYDGFTPKYRSYHTQDEIRSWFAQNDFTEINVTNTINDKYGFGMLGIRTL
jgi:ubiquinone/menaquinone biosynthesis C-methylase UbiE